MKRLFAAAAALALLASATIAGASPLPYTNTILNSPYDAVIAVTSAVNSTQATAAPLITASGTTTATATSLRFTVSVTGLTTAASTLSAAMTVTNTTVSASTQVFCQVNGYTGTGVPIAVNVTPGAGTLAFNIQNVSTGAALNATVPVACIAFT